VLTATGTDAMQAEQYFTFQNDSNISTLSMLSNEDVTDFFKITTTTHGRTTLETINGGSSAAHLSLTADNGSLKFDSGAGSFDFFRDGGSSGADFMRISLDANAATEIRTHDGAADNANLSMIVDGHVEIHKSTGTSTSDQYLQIDPDSSTSNLTMYEAAGASTDDYFKIAVDTAGATKLTTVDAAATAANFEIEADGDITLDAAGAIALESSTDTTINTRVLSLENVVSSHGTFLNIKDSNNSSAERMAINFTKDKGAAGANGDSIFGIHAKADNAAQELTDFASITTAVIDAADTDEAGALLISVATSNGTTSALQNGLLARGHGTNNDVDVTLGYGSTSETTVAGNLTVSSDLTVSGTTTTVNTTNLNIEDKNITLNYNDSSDTSGSADGAGITIQDAVDASNDATILWTASSDTFTFSHGINATINTATQGTIDHDSLANFVAAEHYRWDTDISSTATIHTNNITDLHGAGVDGANNQLLTDDGDGTISSESELTYIPTSGLQVNVSALGKGSINIINSHDGSTGGSLNLTNQRDGNGLEDADVLGNINFVGADVAGQSETYGSIIGSVVEADNGNEAGQIAISVANDGTERNGITMIADKGTAQEVDVTIANGAASVTTISGNANIISELAMGSPAVSSMNSSGLLLVGNQSNITGLGTLSSLAVTSSASLGSAAMTLTNADVDEVALDINTDNTTANIIDIDARALTHGNAIIIDSHSIAGGSLINLDVEDIYTLAPILNHNTNPTKLINIDYDKSGVTQDSGSRYVNALDISMVDAATNHANSTNQFIGVNIAIDAASNQGSIKQAGVKVTLTDADTSLYDSVGFWSITEDGGHDFLAQSSANEDDYFSILTTTNGSTVLKTVDDDAALAHFEVEADGNITLDAVGDIALESGADSTNSVSIDHRKFSVSTSTDGNAVGDVVYFGGTTSMTTGAIYHYNSSGNWELADADDNTKSDGLLGVALGAASDTNGVLLRGMVTIDHDPGDIGDVLYLTTTAGDCSATAPSGNGNIVRIIGYQVSHASNGNIWFNPDSTFVEVNA